MACFLDCLGTLKVELASTREHDSHAVDLLFSGLISRPDFAADFFETFRIFKFVGFHLGSRLGALAPSNWARLRRTVMNKCGIILVCFLCAFGYFLGSLEVHLGGSLGGSLWVHLAQSLFFLNIRRLVGSLSLYVFSTPEFSVLIIFFNDCWFRLGSVWHAFWTAWEP